MPCGAVTPRPPVDPHLAGAAGKEVVSRFSAPSLSSRSTFYTDANGREFQARVRDNRPTWDLNVTQPVAGNFYPVTAAAFVKDEGSGGGDDGDDGVQVRGGGQGCGIPEQALPACFDLFCFLCARFRVRAAGSAVSPSHFPNYEAEYDWRHVFGLCPCQRRHFFRQRSAGCGPGLRSALQLIDPPKIATAAAFALCRVIGRTGPTRNRNWPISCRC